MYQRKHQDQASFEQLVERLAEQFDTELRNKIVHFFKRRHMSNAEDLAHEVFIRMRNKLTQGVEVHNFTAYAFAIARYIESEERRRGGGLIAFSSLPPEDLNKVNLLQNERLNPEPQLEQDEERKKWLELRAACLQELSPEDRELLFNYYSINSKELAIRLGIEASHLRVKVHRIRARLRWSLKRKLKREKQGRVA